MKAVHRQKGAIILPFVISVGTIIVLAGMVAESSMVLHARGRLFNDAESAVLAAANLYAEESNQDFGTLNSHIKTYFCGNTFLDADVTELDFSQVGNNMMVLTTQKNIPLLFLPDNLVTLTATVAASTPQPVGSTSGAAPLAVEDMEYVVGQEYVLKEGGGGGTTGNYGPLAIGGTGAGTYEDNLKYGTDETISVGDAVLTKPGNMNGPTQDAIEYRLANGQDVIIVVMTNDVPQGRDSITVTGFAAFRITGVDNHGEITGTFITYKLDAEPAEGAGDFNLYTVPKLVFY